MVIFRLNKIFVAILILTFLCVIGENILFSKAWAVRDCGEYSDTCPCGANNRYDCPNDCGNCGWWAWHKACCEWGDGLFWTEWAVDWFDTAKKAGYPTGKTPKEDSIFVAPCKDTGHVGWVTKVNADGSFDTSEQARGGWIDGTCGTKYFYNNTNEKLKSTATSIIGFIYKHAPSMKFQAGDHVKTTSSVYMHKGAGRAYEDGKITLPPGSAGEIVFDDNNGVWTDGYYWWHWQFEGYDGWSVEDFLAPLETSCTISPGEGAPDQTTTNKFIDAYNSEGGEATIGCATANVDTFSNTFYSPPISGYCQDFDGGYAGCRIEYVPDHSPSAYLIKLGFYETFMSLASEIGRDVHTLLVSPTENERPSSSSSAADTIYTWQPFIKGSMYYFDDSHILDGTQWEGHFDGEITYVWGHISDRYKSEGGRNGDLGLPLFNVMRYEMDGEWVWWYQWFEKGLIWLAKHSSYGEWTFAYKKTADVYSNGEWLELGWVKY